MDFSIPKVGDGATICVGSDSYPATVVKVTAKTATIQDDTFTPAPGYDYYSNQVYTYAPNVTGHRSIVRLTKRGWRYLGTPVYFGHRRAYRDPSF
jgi:hypothetical protein